MNIDSINNFLLDLQKIPTSEKIFFVQHLRVMIKSGASLSSALNALSLQSDNKKFKIILVDIKNSVEKGNTFSKSLEKYDKEFGDFFINMIEAGEASGKLEEVLTQIFIQMKKDHEIKSKVKGAMIYPLVVLSAMIIIGVLMIIFVIPQMTSILVEAGVELPLMTRILIGTSDFAVNNGIIVCIFLGIFITGFMYLIKTKTGKYYFHIILLHLPIFGKIIKKINLARFARTLSSLLKTDIPIAKTLEMTSKILGNVIYKEAMTEASEQVTKGISIAETFKNKNFIFPPVVTEIIVIGEETGSLDNVLSEMAEFYEEEIDQTMKNLPSIIEPVLILILGMGVALMAVAIMMPMYSLSDAI